MTVTIALALYNPRIEWLEEQLRSIAGQTVRPIELLAIDDASATVPFSQIESVFSAVFEKSDIPYTLTRNEKNLGSDLTFAGLTELAQGDFISYCDQDDSWLPRKTGALLEALMQTGAPLAYSDLSVMDAAGKTTAKSLRYIRRRLRHLRGEGLARPLLFRNFTNGTAMMMPANIAKGALPFVGDMTADHWLTLWAATKGEIVYLPEPLVRYRLHGDNQSAVMSGVTDKKSYLERRILTGVSRFEQFKTRLAHEPGLSDAIEGGERWFEARRRWMEEAAGCREVWKCRKWGKQVTLFELLTARLPEPVFIKLVRLVQKGIV
jgi:glycosyltransferase involved in cell wall biosynthesis